MNYPTTLFTTLLMNTQTFSKLPTVLQWALWDMWSAAHASSQLCGQHCSSKGLFQDSRFLNWMGVERTGHDYCHLVVIACKCSGSLHTETRCHIRVLTGVQHSLESKVFCDCTLQGLILQRLNKHPGLRVRELWWLNIRTSKNSDVPPTASSFSFGCCAPSIYLPLSSEILAAHAWLQSYRVS